MYELFIEWSKNHGIKILVILIGTFAVHRIAHGFIDRGVRKIVVPDKNMSPVAEEKRENTLIKVFHSAFVVLLWIMASLMILSEIGVEIGPLIAAAGIAGVAIGFGGQYLIKDIISGFFIILENQYRVNDVVCFGKTCGSVESINLRLTVIRDLDGVVHHIPNGEIATASNLTKLFSRVNLTVGVSYHADLEHVIEVTNRVGKELAEDPEWKDKIQEPPQFLRVDDFADSSVNIKILGDTVPGEQWAVAGELRKRLKITYDKEGIEIPFPQRVIHEAEVKQAS